MKQKLLALAVVSALAMGASSGAPAATSYMPFDNASIIAGDRLGPGGKPDNVAQLVSDSFKVWPAPTADGGIVLGSPKVNKLSDLTLLATEYRMGVGDCVGGSPRFAIHVLENETADGRVTPEGNIFVYVGPPTVTGCLAGWQNTDNLLTGPVDATKIGGAYSDTWENVLSRAGTSPVSSIALVVDAGWRQHDGVQTVLVDNVRVNDDTVTFEPDTTLVIPLVAETASYTSEVTVRNPNSKVLPISVAYTGATGTLNPGRHECASLSVLALSGVQLSAAKQCQLPRGSQFGYVTLTEPASTPSPFLACSRVQAPGGNRFSVPAYPIDAIDATEYGSHVVGIKRQAAAPPYQSNCFVASTDAATPYQIRLLDSAGSQVGNTVKGTVNAYDMVRYLDNFAAAGIPADDRRNANVSVEFSSGTSKAALIGFCTFQESTYFGADFRMAQPAKLWK